MMDVPQHGVFEEEAAIADAQLGELQKCGACGDWVMPGDGVFGHDPMESLSGAVWFHGSCAVENGIEPAPPPGWQGEVETLVQGRRKARLRGRVYEAEKDPIEAVRSLAPARRQRTVAAAAALTHGGDDLYRRFDLADDLAKSAEAGVTLATNALCHAILAAQEGR